MARKKRTFEQFQPAVAGSEDPSKKVAYQDPIQEKVNSRLDGIGKRLEGQGRNFMYGAGALVVLLILIGIFALWNKRANAAAQTALGKAIETSQAVVSASPLPAGSTVKSFKTEKERSEAAVAEFQDVATKYGGAVGEKAKYLAAVNKIGIDRPAATTELEALASSNDDVGELSKFALAQVKAEDGKTDEAITAYQQLAGMSNTVLAKDTINFALASLLEKQGKKQEAADVYFNIAKAASEAKDSSGKSVPMSQTARDAKDKLQALDPDRAKTIEEPKPESPFGN